jgi:hypothetical protein
VLGVQRLGQDGADVNPPETALQEVDGLAGDDQHERLADCGFYAGGGPAAQRRRCPGRSGAGIAHATYPDLRERREEIVTLQRLPPKIVKMIFGA